MHILPGELLEDEGTAKSDKRKEMAMGNGISSTNISIGPYTTIGLSGTRGLQTRLDLRWHKL